MEEAGEHPNPNLKSQTNQFFMRWFCETAFSKISLVIILYCVINTISIDGLSQQEKSTKVIAHRGAWKNTGVTENSIAALQFAIQLGCYGSEFDVHMSSDSVPYVLHDHAIKGTHIEKSTAAELSQIKLSNGEALPTLRSYLEAGKNQNNTRLILEIKSSSISKERSLALAAKCVEMVKMMNVSHITEYIAFDFDVCKKVKELDSKAIVTYLNGDKSPDELLIAGLNGMDYHLSVYRKHENWLNEAKNKNLITNVWTVNDKEAMRWFIERNIDFITTNEPEQLMELLKK